MDGMALLCTLHARGPTTLRRLRKAGIQALSEIPSLDEHELAYVLDGSPVFARRFAREALLLARRLGEGSEPEGRTAPTGGAPAVTRSGRTERELQPPQARIHETRIQESQLRESQIRESPSGELRPMRPAAGTLRAGSASTAANPGPPARMPIPGGAPRRAPGEALRPGLLEGLDATLCARLFEQGVCTVEDFLRAADLDLARRMAFSYPRLLDLTFEARRYLGEGSRGGEERGAFAALPVLSRSAGGGDEAGGAGGPFA